MTASAIIDPLDRATLQRQDTTIHALIADCFTTGPLNHRRLKAAGSMGD